MNPVATAQTLVSGASLAAASTFIVEYPCDPTNVPVGILWTWSANKNHSVTFGRARASCAAITSIERVTTPVPLTAPDNTAWGYDERIQPSGGFTYLHFVITNNDGANAMSYTVTATPLYDSTAASPGSQAGASGTVDIGTVAIDQTTPGGTNGVVERTMGELAPLIGFGNYAAAQTDTALIADPGSGVAIYVTDIVVTNDSTAAITVFLESDTASAKTAITPTYKIPASGGMALHFRTPIKGTVHKNLGVTTTGVSNFTVEAHGYSAA